MRSSLDSTEDLNLTFSGEQILSVDELLPRDTQKERVQIKNFPDREIYYELYRINVVGHCTKDSSWIKECRHLEAT